MISDTLSTQVSDYAPSPEKLAGLRDTSMLFMVGISGAGKDTITANLMRLYPHDYTRFISHTTRKPRENHGKLEQNGKDYYFIDFDKAQAMLAAKDFIEANVYSGNIYATSIAELRRAHDQHKTLVTDIDVNGVAHFVGVLPNAKPVFILPPNFRIWQQRFLTRYKGEVNEADYQKRMHTAYIEIVHALAHNYYYLVINDDLDHVTREINAIARGEVAVRQSKDAMAVADEILQELRKII